MMLFQILALYILHITYPKYIAFVLYYLHIWYGDFPLKPQDSFGELDKLFLDLQKVQYIIRKHN